MNFEKSIDNLASWERIFHSQEIKNDYQKVIKDAFNTVSKDEVFPTIDNVLNAFRYCNYENLKLVILGQDPYHGEGQAHGLAFSVPEGIEIPPSLKNIFKEIADDLNLSLPDNGNLERWARQGVLLLNSVLTVQKNQAGSHRNMGWEKITDRIIQMISEDKENVVFILWGNYAKEKEAFINKEKHFVLTAAHPSPLSAYKGFFGCRHFSKANAYLEAKGIARINW
ncbi:MAG: uracil-DNA glycosylase [bacterium]|jgi:uracil-DNA glycosylase